MVYADLHVHTDNSDGKLTLAAIPAAARSAGVSVVGVTDHDRLHPDLTAPVTVRDEITLVNGLELRVETPVQRVDLLAYGMHPTEELRAELDRIQRNRIERGRRICACVEDQLGVRLEIDFEPGVGRPHIARAVMSHPETDYESVDEVFADLIGAGDPCFVSRDVPRIETSVSLLRESSEVVGLAHPLRYSDPIAALERCSSLDAVERYYPYNASVGCDSPVGFEALDRFIEEYDLYITGGSDAHDATLGTCGLSETEYARFETALLPGS